MEENYHTLSYSVGLLSDPIDGYYWVLICSFLAVTMPCWMPFYFYLCYNSITKVWSMYSQNSRQNKLEDFENDPDFEQEDEFEGDAKADKSEDSKKDTPNNEGEKESTTNSKKTN